MAVIIPAYNEAENLPDTLARIPRGQVPNMRVIVVDDGSTDGSAEVARLHGADSVVSHSENRGLGAALRTGLAAASNMDARAAVYIDADGEYPPEQIPDLLKPIDAGEADYVLGSRYPGHPPAPATRSLGRQFRIFHRPAVPRVRAARSPTGRRVSVPSPGVPWSAPRSSTTTTMPKC